MFYVYILYSPSKDSYYVGYTHDLKLRIERHNAGLSKSTKSGVPWEIVYFEEYANKSDAIKRENYIKKQKSRKYIQSLLEK